MRNRKGQAAAFLTLGLVVLGAVIALGSSFFVNKNNIASGSRASSCNMVNCQSFGQYTGMICYSGSDFYSGTCGSSGCTGTSYPNGWHGGCTVATPTAIPQPTQGSGGGGSKNCPFSTMSSAKSNCDPYGFTQVGCNSGTWQCLNTIGGANPTATPAPTVAPTAGASATIPNPGAACCFVSSAQSANQCSNGADYIRVYAHASARVNNDMSTPCTSDPPPNGYGSAYGASKWFYCADSTVDGCSNASGYDLTVPTKAPTAAASAAGQCQLNYTQAQCQTAGGVFIPNSVGDTSQGTCCGITSVNPTSGVSPTVGVNPTVGQPTPTPSCNKINPNFQIPTDSNSSISLVDVNGANSQDITQNINSAITNQLPQMISSANNQAAIENKVNHAFNSALTQAVSDFANGRNDLIPGSHIAIKVGNQAWVVEVPVIGAISDVVKVKKFAFLGLDKVGQSLETHIVQSVVNNLNTLCVK